MPTVQPDMPIKFLTNSPNFSLVLPGTCNARCSFCFWQEEKEAKLKDFLLNLDRSLKALPLEFKQISITGGEPTLSPLFEDVLALIKQHRNLEGSSWNKVVLTTNGHNLKVMMKYLRGVVDHVNISRHAIKDEDNQAIFGTDTVPTAADLYKLTQSLNKRGIDATLNVVLPSLEMDSPEMLQEWDLY